MARTQVQSELIATNAISGTIIADNAITATHIATNAISGTLVQSSGITTDMIASNNVTAAKIVSDGIETRHLHSNVISGQSSVTAASGDYVLIGDTSDSNNLKKALVSDFGVSGISSSADATAITIDSSENVGIGDTSPDVLFHVNSASDNVVARFESTDTEARIQLKDTTGVAYIAARNDLRFGNDTSTERMRIDSSGHVGIGMTAAPVGSDTVLALYNSATPRIKLHNSTTGTASGDGGEINMSGSDFILENREAGNVRLFNNGSERMRIDSSGKVGIGTSSPANNLHIHTDSGDEGLTIKSTGDTSNAIIIDANRGNAGAAINALTGKWNGTSVADILFLTGADTTNKDDGVITFRTSSADNIAERMRIDSSGNVGVGTTSPTEKLTVNGALALTGALADDRTSTAAMDFSSGVTRIVSYGAAGTAGITSFRQAAGGASSAEFMRILGTGEVHITSGADAINPTIKHGGATGDLAKLRLINRSGQSSDKGGVLELGAITDDGVSRSDVLASVAGLKINATSANREGYLQFSTSNGSALTEGMRIDSGGRLLINKTTSSLTFGKLQVEAGGEASGHGGIVFFGDSDVSVGSGNVINVLWFYGDNDATGGVFTRYRDGNSIMGQVTAANGTQVSYGVSSDERLKENIVDASSQLDTIKNIKVREFDWKVNGYHEVGMIAQELNSVVPSVVQEGGDDINEEVWGVDYGKLTPYLIKAVQELSAKNDALEARIATLEG